MIACSTTRPTSSSCAPVRIRPETTKSGRDRSVPIAKEARIFLKAYLSTRKDDSPALFVGQQGRFTDRGIRDIVAKYAGVFPRRPRNTFAYDYLRANNNELVAPGQRLDIALATPVQRT